MRPANLLQSGNRPHTGHALRGGLALAVTGVVMVVLALAPHAAAAPPDDGGGDPERIIETITVVFVEDDEDIDIGDPLVVENPAGPQADPPAAPPVDTPDVAVLGVEHERTAPAPELPRTGAGTIGLAAAGLLALLLGMHLMAWSRRLTPVAVATRR